MDKSAVFLVQAINETVRAEQAEGISLSFPLSDTFSAVSILYKQAGSP